MKWLGKIRQAFIRDVAGETIRQLEGQRGCWEEFLPPVAFHDCIYMVTKTGSVYRMHQDSMQGMEIITQIRTR
jgi:hypothetical protein